jgi:hypothetical protein
MASDDHRQLLDTVTADGDGSAVGWNGGRGTFVLEGTMNGATATLQWSRTASTYHTVGTDTTLTATGIAGFELAPGFLRVNIASAGASTSLSAWAIGSRVD